MDLNTAASSITALDEAVSTVLRERLLAEEDLALVHPGTRLGPISACPNEIISMIMVVTYCSMLEDEGDRADPTKILLSISQVSRLWRDVSISLTQMWARVHVEWNPKQRALWLQRSGTRPIDVYLQHLVDRPLPTQLAWEQDLLLHPQRWRSLSVATPESTLGVIFLNRLQLLVNLQSLESLRLLYAPSFSHRVTHTGFRLGGDSGSRSALHTISLRDCNLEALDCVADNVVTLTLSGIREGDDSHFWALVIGTSLRLERLILSRLRYGYDIDTIDEPAIPVRAHLQSLVLGGGNGRCFFRYMIREIKAPILRSLDLRLPRCNEQYGREITDMIIEFFKSSPLIEFLTIRINCLVATKILKDLCAPFTDDEPVLSANIRLPRLRHLKFDQLFEDRNEMHAEDFLDQLEDFLVFRSIVSDNELESRGGMMEGPVPRPEALEDLTLESFLHDQRPWLEYYVRDLIATSGNPTAYEYTTFHDIGEQRSGAYDAGGTWDELDVDVWDDNGRYAEE